MSHVLIAILILLQIADWWTTQAVLAKGGRELNPVVRWGLRVFGYDYGLAIIKTAAAVPLVLIAVALPVVGFWWWPWAVAALIVWYAVIVANNAVVLHRLG